MLRRLLVCGLLMGCVEAVFAAEPSVPAATAPKSRRILYNHDGFSGLYLKKGQYAPGLIAESDLKAIVDELTQPGSQVDTLLLCFNAQATYYPSKVGTMVGSLNNADDPDPGFKQFMKNLNGFYDRGVDPYAIVLAEAKRRGLEALLSYRMNDAHSNAPLRCKLWVDHPECRLGHGLDFARDEVRDYTFRLIEEAVGRYDCDGIELDFVRFPTYFRETAKAEDIRKINALVHRAREMLDTEGQRRGRRLVLAARVPVSMEECQKIGLDPATWAKQGWIDFLTVAEFLYIRYDLPVKPWKELVREVPIYASIDCLCHEGIVPEKIATPEGCRRAARYTWNDGADGIYLFNFFTYRECGAAAYEPPFEVLKELGNPTTLNSNRP